MYVRVGVFKLKAGVDVDELARLVEAEQVPIMQQHPGFVSYELIRTGADSCVSISRWESEALGVEAGKATGAWVQERIADRIESSEMHRGTAAVRINI